MIDWPLLFSILRVAGYPTRKVELALNLKQGRLASLATGRVKQPLHDAGEELLTFARGVLPADQLQRAGVAP